MRTFLFLFLLILCSTLLLPAQDLQEGDAYPDVVIVPIDAFRENRDMNKEDAAEIGTAIWQYCLKDNKEAARKDWNTLRQNPNLDLQGIRYFITYSYYYNPETGVCSVTLVVYSGPAYNPRSSASVATFSGSSERGATNPEGREIESASDCRYSAAAAAAKELCNSELFREGWEVRPFPDNAERGRE